jgi:hypothetical protein
MGCNMSVKIQFLESHLYFFPENIGEVSDEHSENVRQGIMAMETREQGMWTSRMLADYCRTLKSDVPDAKYLANIIRLYILEERFCLFHEHKK